MLSAVLLERWPQICRIKITFTKLPTDRFVSTTKHSMKRVVNWIPLRIRVHSRTTQPHLKELWEESGREYIRFWTELWELEGNRESSYAFVFLGDIFPQLQNSLMPCYLSLRLDCTHNLVSSPESLCFRLNLGESHREGTGTRPDYLPNCSYTRIMTYSQKERCGSGRRGHDDKGHNVAQYWNQIQTLKECFGFHKYCAHFGTPLHQIVGDICTVPNRVPRYPHFPAHRRNT